MKKVIPIAIVILAAALVIFNFIAANLAEKRIDEAIQVQTDSSAFSVQYSSIKVTPFRGDIDFSDVTIVHGETIDRANHIHVDMRYIDFLNIYLGGIKYGLENLSTATILFKKPTYVNRQTMQQTSLGTALMKYEGNVWDGIRYLFMNRPQAYNHHVDITASQLSYSNPRFSIGSFKSDSASIYLNWPKNQPQNRQARDSLHIQHITWTPPKKFRQKYAFFIQGFGYKQDSIPFSSMRFSTTSLYRKRIQVKGGQLKTDLFTIRFGGTVVRDSTWKEVRLAPLKVSLVNRSPKFENVLQNIEQLLGNTLPRRHNKIVFQLAGPIANPHFKSMNY